MQIEIAEPCGDGIVLRKRGDMVLVRCDCDVASCCPQQKRGSEPRCQVWMKLSHLSAEAIEHTKRENRFTR